MDNEISMISSTTDFYTIKVGRLTWPPFSGAYGSHRHLSEYTPSKSAREMFDDYRERGVSVIDVY